MEWKDIKESEGKKRVIHLRSGKSFVGTIISIGEGKEPFNFYSNKIQMLDKYGNTIIFYLQDIEAMETIKGVDNGE